MGSKIETSLPSSRILVVFMLQLLIGFATSDLAQDREECATQLVGLATCLPYVGGQAKTPTVDCCTGLKQVLQKSRKCLCILIKDRDDPNLGLKINATLAATLPSSCHAPANVTECIDLLHLPPGSPDAKVFAGFVNITKGTGAVPVSTGNTTSSAEVKSDGERVKRGWLGGVEIIYGCLICVFIYFAI